MKVTIKTTTGIVILEGYGPSVKEFIVANKGSLSEADLAYANLEGADLTGADLSYADLAGANLRDANLAGVDLTRADLRGASLAGANLRRANLEGTHLRGTDLYAANLKGTDISEADLEGTDLDGILGLPAHVKQIKGSRHIITMLSEYNVTIGCRRNTLAWWLENYRKIGKKEGYTPEQIAEYGGYLSALSAL